LRGGGGKRECFWSKKHVEARKIKTNLPERKDRYKEGNGNTFRAEQNPEKAPEGKGRKGKGEGN